MENNLKYISIYKWIILYTWNNCNSTIPQFLKRQINTSLRRYKMLRDSWRQEQKVNTDPIGDYKRGMHKVLWKHKTHSQEANLSYSMWFHSAQYNKPSLRSHFLLSITGPSGHFRGWTLNSVLWYFSSEDKTYRK